MKKVLYFTAIWCGPCKKTRPIVEELISNNEADIQIIDADSELDLIKKYEIRSIPTFILLENDIEIDRAFGTKTKEDLQNFIKHETIN